jgi:flagellar biosynthesis regulator FlaF
MDLANVTDDGLALSVPALEMEIRRLRQLLSEAKSKGDGLLQEVDELRRDRDRWQALAERLGATPSTVEQRAWFCGRASSRG